jgi:hypothetical protein
MEPAIRPALPGRRTLLKGAALGAIAFTVGGAEVWLTPREAFAQGVPMKVLTAAERAALEALGDTLLPGAKDAGIAHFVDSQLAAPPGDCLLAARSANVPPPILNFYRAALRALDGASNAAHGKPFAELTPGERNAFVDGMRQKVPEGWQGPPSPFVYFLLRNDAVDVVYGTVEGFERLGIPYMPHVVPPAKW